MKPSAKNANLVLPLAQNSILEEIEARIRWHQQRIGEHKIIPTTMQVGPLPLTILAQGDSWFDYPLRGNDIITFGFNSDLIAQLEQLAITTPAVLNFAVAGESSTQQLSLTKQQRMIEALQDKRNWFGEAPDAILFSAGGNDIAGEHFCIFLDYLTTNSSGLNMERFEKVLGMVKATYEKLFALRDRFAPGVPIFSHNYDFALPTGVGLPCKIGPWIQPSLKHCGWNDEKMGASIVRAVLSNLSAMLESLAADEANNFTLINTQGTLRSGEWANELHPTPSGFRKLAEVIIAELRRRFPERI